MTRRQTEGRVEEARATVAELRRRYRRFRWSSQRGLRAKLVVAAKLALRPGLAAIAASRLVYRHGGVVAQRHGVSRIDQFARMWWLRIRHGLEPDWYYRFALFRPEEWARAELYVRMSEARDLFILLRSYAPRRGPSTFGDKRNFEAWCANLGLPSAHTLMVVDGRSAANVESVPPPFDLFSKPANSQGGEGAHRWRFEGGRYAGDDGASRDTSLLLAELRTQSLALGRPIIVQRCLSNHPDLARFTSGALGTVRLVTSRSLDGVVEARHALLKMPVGRSPVDNFHGGNLAAPVDMVTGRLGTATQMSVGLLGERLERHPDTGALIEGAQLPYWSELVALALRAHSAIDDVMPLVGWDIAITGEGPVLVEGNGRPGAAMQLIHRTPLGETRFATILLEYLRAYAP